jgi:hypothetical protein
MKKHTIIPLATLAVILLLTAGCRKYARIVGNNQVTSETRQLVAFDRVVNSGTFHVYIRQDSTFTATVEAESNLIPHIRTRINGNTLVIDTRENLQENYPMNVFVTTPVLLGADLSGSGTVMVDTVDTESMEVTLSGSGRMSGYINAGALTSRISGSGNINLEAYTNQCNARISGSGDMDIIGETSEGDFSISGSGNIRTYNFLQEECNARISGSGNMYVNVSDMLNVSISGSGSVFYIGDPTLNVDISGSGQVIKQ